MEITTYEVQRTTGYRTGFYVVGTTEDGEKFIASPVFRLKRDAKAQAELAAIMQLPKKPVVA